MKVLIAEDDASYRNILNYQLKWAGYEVVTAENGAAAWDAFKENDPPQIVILDWMMPEMDGLEVCRRIRQQPSATPVYIIMLTAKTNKTDIVQGLEAGANDYILKPFHAGELRARVQVGMTVVNLQRSLAARIVELEKMVAHVKLLQGVLPICSYCKKIRDDRNYWQAVESYISQYSDARFSHGICPDCYESFVKEEIEQMEKAAQGDDGSRG